MAVQHPVPGTSGNKLHIAGLRHTHQHRVARPPCGFGNTSAFGSSYLERVAMKMHGMMIHAHVHEADTHAISLANDQGRGRRPRLPVEQKPVVFHIHGVGHGVVGQHRVLLQVQQKVFIAVWKVGRTGMHDDTAQHAQHLLHGHVGVIKVGSCLVNIELVDESAAGFHRLLANTRHAVVPEHVFKAMPVNGGCFGQMVVEDHADMIALVYLNGWPGRGPVVSPRVDGFVGVDCLFQHFGNQMEDLGAAIHGVGKIAHLGGHDRRGEARWLSGLHGVRWGRAGLCRYAAGGEESRTSPKGTLKERTSVTHGNSGDNYAEGSLRREDKSFRVSNGAQIRLSLEKGQGKSVYIRRAVMGGEEPGLLRSAGRAGVEDLSCGRRSVPEGIVELASTIALAWLFANRSTAQ